MTAADTVAVEDAGAVEKAVRIKATGRGIDLPRITHPPTSGRLADTITGARVEFIAGGREA
jgi:hypothetical protein